MRVPFEDPAVFGPLVIGTSPVVVAVIKGFVKIVCTWMLSRNKPHPKKDSKRKRSRKASKRKEHGLSE